MAKIKRRPRKFAKAEQIPRRQAGGKLTRGCLVCEGGAFRGIYGEGVLDALMHYDINMDCVIGVSAGALNGMNYVAGEMGRAARGNLEYRHNRKYVGLGAFPKNKGVYGFDFAFHTWDELDPFNEEEFNRPERRFIAVATSLETGGPVYFEKGKCTDIFKAVQASASMPYVSKPVEIDGKKYLDGGSGDKIPFQWAIDQGYEKIIVVTTRPRGFRKPELKTGQEKIARKVYRKYPEFARSLEEVNALENNQRENLEHLADQGRVYAIMPSDVINRMGRMEGDMNLMGHVYHEGYADVKKQIEKIREYLG